jgi:hypothetical protein
MAQVEARHFKTPGQIIAKSVLLQRRILNRGSTVKAVVTYPKTPDRLVATIKDLLEFVGSTDKVGSL